MKLIEIKTYKPFFILLLWLFPFAVMGQKKVQKNEKGWQITYRTKVDIKNPDTTEKPMEDKQTLKEVLAKKAKIEKIKIPVDLTENFVRFHKMNSQTLFIINKKEQQAIMKKPDQEPEKIKLDLSEDSFLDEGDSTQMKPVFTKEYKKIEGYRCQKIIIRPGHSAFKEVDAWVTKKLPATYWTVMDYMNPDIGAVLEVDMVINDNISFKFIAATIQKKKWSLSHFTPFQMHSSSPQHSTQTTAKPKYVGGSAFKHGYARLILKDSLRETAQAEKSDTLKPNNIAPSKPVDVYSPMHKSIYIDTTGKVVFTRILKGGFLSKKDQIEPAEAYKGNSVELPTQYVLVQNGYKYGVLNVGGQWILKPKYEFIDTRLSLYWVVDKDGKESLFTVDGFLMPFQFEKVEMMNDNYFNVRQNGKWGVYSRKDKSLSVPAIYEDMDYCYGCEADGDYCFAKKDGKWGVIDFHNKVLLPFEYEHKHRNMRSDEWVASLFKDGKQLLINLKTKKEKPWDCNCGASASENDSTEVAQGFIRVRKGDKYGLLNPEGKQILPYQYNFIRYDAAPPNSYHMPAPYVQINKNQHWGVADTTGHILIPPVYTTGISFELGNFFVCEKKLGDDHYVQVLLDKQGKPVLDSDYKSIETAYTDNDSIPYFKLKKDNRFGFYTPSTQKLVKPQYDQISDYLFNITKKGALKVTKDGKEGLVDVNTGKVIVPALYNNVNSQDSLQPHLYIVENEGKFGVFDAQKQKLIIPLEYDYLRYTKEKKLFEVRNDQKYGLVNLKNQEVIPLQYFAIQNLKPGFFLLTQQDSTYHNTFSFYNVTKQSFRKAPDSTEVIYNAHLATIKEKGKTKLWDPLANKVIEGTYSKNGFPNEILYFSHGLAVSYKDGKAGVIDTLGQVVIPFKYEGLSDFYKGYALVLTDKIEGQEDKYPFSQSSREFLSGFKHYGFIDSTGTVVVSPKYDLQWNSSLNQYFKDGLLILYIGDQWASTPRMGLADRKGEIVVPPKYDKVMPQENGSNYLVKKGKQFGILDAEGRVILPVVFKDVALDHPVRWGQGYEFNFPILAKKEDIWQYYQRNGQPLPITVKGVVQFTRSTFGNIYR